MLARMLHQIGIGDIESIRITDEKVTVHVETGRDAGSGSLRTQKTVSRVRGESARVYDPHGIEHGTSVLVENHIIADGVPDHLQTGALGFKSRSIGAVVETLNGSRIHEVQL